MHTALTLFIAGNQVLASAVLLNATLAGAVLARCASAFDPPNTGKRTSVIASAPPDAVPPRSVALGVRVASAPAQMARGATC